MRINITNYEEYFLLYADKELSKEDRREVELFVENNPSFKEEFTLICETVLLPEQQIFPDKSILFKHETIAVKDYEELINLYIDNELKGREKAKAEKVFNEDITLNKEVELMKRATLKPDLSIQFPSKETLYRYEVNVIPLIWKRLAAAAILFGFGIWFTNQYLLPDTKNYNVTAKVKSVAPSEIIPKRSITTSAIDEKNSAEEQIAHKAPEESIIHNNDIITKAKKTDRVKNEKDKTPVNTIANTDNTTKKLTNDLPVPDINYTSPSPKTKDIATVATSDMNPENQLAVENKTTSDALGFKSVPVSYIVQDENNDDGSGNYAEQRFHKSKLGSFLKKATRTIKRNLIADRNHEN